MKFLTVCLNPVIQRTYILSALHEDRVNRALSYRVDASGKGINVTRVLHQLGEPVVHLTQAGGTFRDYFLALVRQDGLQLEWVESQADIRTCCTLLNQGKHTSTEIVEEAREVDPLTETRIRDRFQALLPQIAMLILSGSKAPGFSSQLFPWMVALAKKQGKTVLLDFRGPELTASLPYVPDLIKPNRSEFVETFFPGESPPEEKEIVDRMLDLSHSGMEVVLTHGSAPVLAVRGGKLHSFPVPELTPVNTIGSGDAFAAGLASVWLETHDLLPAIHQGIRCAQQNALQLRPGVLHDDYL